MYQEHLQKCKIHKLQSIDMYSLGHQSHLLGREHCSVVWDQSGCL